MTNDISAASAPGDSNAGSSRNGLVPPRSSGGNPAGVFTTTPGNSNAGAARDGLNMAPLTSLVPAQATIGGANFTLHVHGEGFLDIDAIFWNGGFEPTNFVSPTELTTIVNMAFASVGTIPVHVQRSSNGAKTAPLTFTFEA